MKKSLTLFTPIAVALAFLLTGCGDDGSSADPSHSQTFSPNDGDGAGDSADKPQATFKDGVLTNADVKIQITRYKIIKAGQKGNEYGEKPVIAFWYKTTNVSGKKVDPSEFIFDFEAYQDNDPNAENKLDVGSLPDDRFLDSQDETIKKGGTVESAIAYELDDLTTPVDLVASEDLGETTIGKATYKLS